MSGKADPESAGFLREAAKGALTKARKAGDRGNREEQETHLKRAANLDAQSIIAEDPSILDEDPFFDPSLWEKRTHISFSGQFNEPEASALKHAASDLGVGDKITLSPSGEEYQSKLGPQVIKEGNLGVTVANMPGATMREIWKRTNKALGREKPEQDPNKVWEEVLKKTE